MQHGLRHQIAVLRRILQRQNGFLLILVNDSAFQKTHGHHEECHVVATLSGAFQVGQIRACLEPGKIDAGQLVLSLGMTGKSGVAEVFCALGRASLAERGGAGIKLILWRELHLLLREGGNGQAVHLALERTTERIQRQHDIGVDILNGLVVAAEFELAAGLPVNLQRYFSLLENQ